MQLLERIVRQARELSAVMKLPKRGHPVRDNYEFAKEIGLDVIVSTNDFVQSCRDAAGRRVRLGEGIPLGDELKTLVYENNGQYYAFHMRAHQEIDEDVALKLIGGTGDLKNYKAYSEDQTAQRDKEYGTQNPLSLARGIEGKKVIQYFDDGILTPRTHPGTMMTNLGDNTTAMEFYPEEMVEALQRWDSSAVRVGTYAVPAKETYKPIQVGILTGNPPSTGTLFADLFIEEIASIFGKHYFGDISNPDYDLKSRGWLGLTMELDLRENYIKTLLEREVRSFCDQGIELLLLPCNTTPYFDSVIHDICSEYDVKYLSLPQAIEQQIERKIRDEKDTDVKSLQDVTLAGIGYTQHRKWSGFQSLLEKGIRTLRPAEQDVLKGFAYEAKHPTAFGQSLSSRVKSFFGRVNTPTIVTGLGELSWLLSKARGKEFKTPQKNVLDGFRLYAKEAALEYVDLASPPEVFDYRQAA